VDQQVKQNPTSSVHRLRVGGLAQASQPLSNISPALVDPRRARYQVSQSQERLGVKPSRASTGGVALLDTLTFLNSELGEEFFVDSGLHSSGFLQFQTAWMKEMVQEAVSDWEDMDPRTDGRHGFITDGNHSFFKGDGVLLTTTVFSRVLQKWVPVLYTWVQSIDAQHHRPHFRRISSIVIQRLINSSLPFDPKYFAHVSRASDSP
jgi:hypothetical protein